VARLEGAIAVDLTGWTITPAGSMIPAGGFFVIEEASFPAGLQASDAVHVFSHFGVQVDAFSWTADPVTSYGRCPDGSGDFVITTALTGCSECLYRAWGALRRLR